MVANAALQPLDSSARNPLICNGAVADFADFGPISESEVGARNGQERVECGRERAIRAADEVRRLSHRRNPHEYAGTGAIGQEKTPTENGWGFVIGGGWG